MAQIATVGGWVIKYNYGILETEIHVIMFIADIGNAVNVLQTDSGTCTCT